jgi:choline dehydrogenase
VNSGLETGFGLSDANVTDGARQSAADAYLRPVMNRHNLKVLTGAEVRRLLIVDGACTGIEYSIDGLISTVEAGREVILTAGAIGTPQLLMLSGIGPAEHLSSVGIDVAHDLPGVGSNLHDHPMSTVVYDLSTPLAFDPHNIYGQGVGLVQTDPSADGPDLQILFISQPYRAGNMSGPDNGYAIGFSAMTPSSRGTVRLADADPATRPLIDPDYLGDEKDVAVMTEGLRIARLIGSREALAQVRGSEAQPGTLIASTDRTAGSRSRRRRNRCLRNTGPHTLTSPESREGRLAESACGCCCWPANGLSARPRCLAARNRGSIGWHRWRPDDPAPAAPARWRR